MLWLWVTIMTTVSAQTLSSAEWNDLSYWQSCESLLQVHPGHGSSVKMQLDAEGKPRKTKTSVLLIPGLYDSPMQMKNLADHFHALDMNVLSLRLAGQFELDATAMRETVQWSEWKSQSERALRVAEILGEKVLLVGHSTGGLIVTWLAIDRPRSVAGLLLFAPAFGVHRVSSWFLRALDKSGLSIESRDGFVISGHAGFEVEKLGAAFAREAAPRAAAALRDVPVWLGATDLDLVINRRLGAKFLASLRPSERPRIDYRMPASQLVLHGTMASNKTRAWTSILRSIGSLLQ